MQNNAKCIIHLLTSLHFLGANRTLDYSPLLLTYSRPKMWCFAEASGAWEVF